jgi:hypothetical protein
MKKYFLIIGLGCVIGLTTTSSSHAQINACAGPSSPGHAVNVAEFGGATYGIDGDLTVVAGSNIVIPNDPESADWYLSSNAEVDVYAAVIIPSGRMVTLKSGAILNIYGNMVNDGILYVEPGAAINFYGHTWTNGASASVKDGASLANTTPGGNINFIAERPAIPQSYLDAGTCAAYSGGDFVQQLDGGNVPMDISLHVQNANNIQLINSATKIEGEIVFDVEDGDIDLGNNNLVFTNTGTWSTNVAPNEAYFITNGTSGCAGAVEKEGLAPNASFVFAIGRAETYSAGRDFTPAILRNNGAAADNFQVRVKSYAEAASIGGVIINAAEEGMDRAWQITSTNGSGVSMGLQHNSATNGSDYTSVFGGDPNAFITQYLGSGDWSTALPPGSISGTVGGSTIHTQGFSLTTTVTNCADAGSWFTKSPDQLTPLPVTLISFKATANDCQVQLNWVVANENEFSHYEVEFDTDAKSFKKVGQVKATGTSNYAFNFEQPSNSGFYKLKMVNKDGSATYSNVIKVLTDCDKYQIQVYPNPANNNIYVKGATEGSKIYMVNAIGQIVLQHTVADNTNNVLLNISHLAAGNYNVIVENESQKQVVKVVKVD